MTIDNFTSYLGKNVVFIVPETFFGTIYKSNEPSLFYRVEGKVSAVLIFEDFSDSQFLVNDDFYFFKDVTFISFLSNPAVSHG